MSNQTQEQKDIVEIKRCIMNDLEKLEKVFTEIGLSYEVKTALQEFGTNTAISNYDNETTFDTIVVLNGGMGYSFFGDFYFLNGKFVNHGLFE